MFRWVPPRVRKLLLLLAVGTTSYVLCAVGYFWLTPTTKFSSPPAASPGPLNTPPTDNSPAPQPLRTLWFGHSLMEYRAAPEEGVPAINIPETVDELHALAREAGKTERPPGVTVSYYEGPNTLIYWAEGPGKGPERIAAAKEPWDYVIGVGFMHLVRQKGGRHTFRSKKFAPRTPKDDAVGALKDLINVMTFGSYYGRKVDAYSMSKYRLIRAVKEHSMSSTWLNYVAPVQSDQGDNQASVDARFACIKRTAEEAGAKVDNVPVGAAIRRAERALAEAGLETKLQRIDRLHYTAAGAYLAAQVFFAYLYEVDPRGLPVPARFESFFEGPSGAKAVKILQEAAHSTVTAAKSGGLIECGSAALPVDNQGKGLLRGTDG